MNSIDRWLVVIPTYNERDSLPELLERLLALPIDFDILFVDDNSPDGTGEFLESVRATNGRIHVLHRPSKLGIGSAHQDGILWGYDQGYGWIVTMDADLTHSAEDLLRVLQHENSSDLLLTSRFIQASSLSEWNPYRKVLTNVGHLLTKFCLGIPQDLTGGLRRYRASSIPREIFEKAESKGYAFLFEIAFLVYANGFSLAEIPVDLSARVYGHSKMSVRQIKKSVLTLLAYWIVRNVMPERLLVTPSRRTIDHNKQQEEGESAWDSYWQLNRTGGALLYDVLATVYRKLFIRPTFEHFFRKTFALHSKLLHAGCGGGHMDVRVAGSYQITAVDISVEALGRYRTVVGKAVKTVHSSVFGLPFPAEEFDGVYNLGVMEHFTEDELRRSLTEFYRIIRPGGQLLLFWPPKFGLSVTILRIARKVLSWWSGNPNLQLHPPEISLLRSIGAARELLQEHGFKLRESYFGPRDLFTQVVLFADKDDCPKAADNTPQKKT